MFESLRPSFVRINKMRETCCCRNHVEFGLHLQSFKKVMAVLDSNLVIPSSTIQFVSSILCDKLEDLDEFKDMECSTCVSEGHLFYSDEKASCSVLQSAASASQCRPRMCRWFALR